jgi:DNA mismatch repair protein MutS
MSLEHTPMMKQFLDVKKDYPDCLLFYRMGDFYELFMEDALIGARVLEIALTKRGQTQGTDIPMCGVPVHAYDHYASKLINKGYRVAICEQLETPEKAKENGNKGPLKRGVVRILTPGTLTEENLLPARQNNYLLALYTPKNGEYAGAYVDVSTGQFYIESVNAKEMGNLIARLRPSEILCPDDWYKSEGRDAAPSEFQRALYPLPPSKFDFQNSQNRIKDFFGIQTLESLGHFRESDVIAAGAVLDYIYLTQKQILKNIEPPKFKKSHNHMVLDAATTANLELFKPQNTEVGQSLFECLNETRTPMGSRRLARYLSSPEIDPEIISSRLEGVTFFYNQDNLCQTLRKILEQIPDMERALSRILIGRGSPRDLGVLRSAMEQANELLTKLIGFNLGINQGIVATLEDALFNLNQISQQFKEALEDNLPLSIQNGGFIKSTFNPELQKFRALSQNAGTAIKELEAQIADETEIGNLKIKFNHILGYFIEVSPSQLSRVPSHFILRQNLSTCSRFTVEPLINLERDILGANARALEIELNIFNGLCSKVAGQALHFQKVAQRISKIDVLTNFAFIAKRRDYTKPTIIPDKTLRIIKGRHPIIEGKIPPSGQPFMANDCVMSPKSLIHLITAPNMSGKSTFLRQNALIIIMAHMGSYVPAEEAQIGVTDRIFSRIGASDDLAAGQSTFMNEMIETATILNQATSQSFVILDEIGRGTATFDGMAIASAVTENLHNQVQCRTLFTTHYHELTELENALKSLECFTMDVLENNDKIIFMHTLKPGKADKSYGIHVAKLAGVPKSVTMRAQSILQSLENQNVKPQQQNLPFLAAQVPPLEPQKNEGWEEQKREIQVLMTMDKILAPVDVNALTPLEALNILDQLKKVREAAPKEIKALR